MTTDIQSILKKIQALRARAACEASSEAEAEMAARKAAELLEKHNLSLTELDVRAEGVERHYWESGRQTRPIEAYACAGIEKLCNVKAWYLGGSIALLGSPADVEAAQYFLDLVKHAIASSWKAHRKSEAYERAMQWESPHSHATAFKKGVAVRLGERLKAMAPPPAPPTAATGTSIVLVKDALIQDWLDKSGLKIGKARRGRVNSYSGYHAGRAAGDGVSLTRGVGVQRSGQLRLGN